MNNRFTITITDDECGVKQYNLSKIVKKAALYAALFLLLFVVVSMTTIFYLNRSVEESEAKKKQIHKAYLALVEKNKNLHASIKKTQKELDEKQTELEEVSNTLAEIETLIGLKPTESLSLQQRVDLTKLSSENMATILEFIPNGSPIKYEGITSKYGWRTHPTLGTREFHPGSDMRARYGTPVHATADGVVEYAGLHTRSGYGRLVIIDNNFGFKTYFGHLSKIKVKAGQFVKKGDLIALSGNSGLSNGPHLHYEVRFISRPLNPYWFIKWSVNNFNEIFQKEKKVPWQSLIAMISKIKVVKKQAQAQRLSLLDQRSKVK